MADPNAPPMYDSQPGYAGGAPGDGKDPGYGEPGQAMVMTTAQPVGQTIIVQQAAPVFRPSSYLGFSIFVMLCCNLVCGMIALIFSVMSSSAADSDDLEGARTKGKVALALNITGILSTVLIVVVIIVLFVTNPLIFLLG